MTIKWRVAELARARGWSARDLARAARIDEKTARNLIKGRATRIDVETIARVADAFDIAPGPLWEAEVDVADRWERVVGSAGAAHPGEIEDALSGCWDVETDPALERASRGR